MYKRQLLRAYDSNEQHWVRSYVDYCRDLKSRASKIWLEASLYEEAGDISIGGHPDFAAIVDGDLYIVDLKTGDISVDPEDNKQLLVYHWLLRNEYYNNVYYSIHQQGICRTTERG